MYKRNKNKVPLTCNELIKKPFQKYPTKFSDNCFSLKAISLKSTNKGREGITIMSNFLKKLSTQNYLKVSMNLNIFELNYVT